MRQTQLCSGGIRLEIFKKMGTPYAVIAVEGDREEREAAPCDPDALSAVLNGRCYHLAGPGWLCSLEQKESEISIALWRDGYPPKKCRVPIEEYQAALGAATGTATAFMA